MESLIYHTGSQVATGLEKKGRGQLWQLEGTKVSGLAVKRPGEDCCLIAVEFLYFGTRGTESSVLPWSYDMTAPPLFGTPPLYDKDCSMGSEKCPTAWRR